MRQLLLRVFVLWPLNAIGTTAMCIGALCGLAAGALEARKDD